MARFKENDLPKSKLTKSSISKALLIFKYAENHKWKFYVGLIFLLFTGGTALAFPKLMGLLIDCVKNKDNEQANLIAGWIISNSIISIGIFLFQIVIIRQFY
jgi:ABC-type multidrug transport system fused ATPase/permease subunit